MMSVDDCLAKAEECRRLAEEPGIRPEYREVLQGMAAQWKEMARNRRRTAARKRQIESIAVMPRETATQGGHDV